MPEDPNTEDVLTAIDAMGANPEDIPGPSRWLPDLGAKVTPLVLAFGTRSSILDTGRRLHEAASLAAAPVEFWEYDGDHFAAEPVLSQLYSGAADWFRRWER